MSSSPSVEVDMKDAMEDATVTTGSSSKKDKKKEDIPDLGGLKRLRKEYGQGHGLTLIGATIFSFLNGSIMELFAVIFAEIIDILGNSVDSNGNTHFQRDSLNAMLYFIGMGVGALIFNVSQYTLWGIYGSKLSVIVRQAYFDALSRQEIGYHEIETSSKLNARLTTECFAIQEAVGTKNGYFLQTMSQFVLGITFAFLYSWQLTLVLLATMPAVVGIGMIQGKLLKGMAGGPDADPYVNAGSFSQEVLTNVRTVLAFPTLIISKLKEYSNLIDIATPIAIKKHTYIGVGLGGFSLGMFGICYSVGLTTGAYFVSKGTITATELFGAYFSFMIGGMGLGQLGSVAADLKAGNDAANKFYQLIERIPKIKQCDGKKSDAIMIDNNKFDASIELENVVFAYPSAPENDVLKGVSISIEAGKTLAIVGPSGSGKSTIIGLLERYYDPKGGNVKIGSELIHNYDLASLRNEIGLVSQMPLLFDTTIKENIRAGREDVTDDEIENAARLANAHEFIMELSKGYDTPVGELGGRISGGQRQRVCIARAICKVPKILLLDEATSALDTKSEKEVQDALDQISNELELTTVVIAHRLSTIKDADKIMVLVDGTVEEIGTHNDLIHENGVYSALVASQQLIEVTKEKHRAQSHGDSMEGLIKSKNDYNADIYSNNDTSGRTDDAPNDNVTHQ